MRFIIAGNLTAARARGHPELLERLSCHIPASVSTLPTEAPTTLGAAGLHANDTVENLYFYIDTFLRRRLNDPETDALNLAEHHVDRNAILAYSRHGPRARPGLRHEFRPQPNPRAPAIGGSAPKFPTKMVRPLLKIIVDELTKVLNGEISASEIKSASTIRPGPFPTRRPDCRWHGRRLRRPLFLRRRDR